MKQPPSSPVEPGKNPRKITLVIHADEPTQRLNIHQAFAVQHHRVRFMRFLFDRWIIVPASAPIALPGFAWSGSRFVPIDGPIQICNFESESAARGYATSLGFEIAE